MQDPIKLLMEQTGLSCDDLLKKLQTYKTNQSDVGDEENVVSSSSSMESEQTLVDKAVETSKPIPQTSNVEDYENSNDNLPSQSIASYLEDSDGCCTSINMLSSDQMSLPFNDVTINNIIDETTMIFEKSVSRTSQSSVLEDFDGTISCKELNETIVNKDAIEPKVNCGFSCTEADFVTNSSFLDCMDSGDITKSIFQKLVECSENDSLKKRNFQSDFDDNTNGSFEDSMKSDDGTNSILEDLINSLAEDKPICNDLSKSPRSQETKLMPDDSSCISKDLNQDIKPEQSFQDLKLMPDDSSRISEELNQNIKPEQSIQDLKSMPDNSSSISKELNEDIKPEQSFQDLKVSVKELNDSAEENTFAKLNEDVESNEKSNNLQENLESDNKITDGHEDLKVSEEINSEELHKPVNKLNDFLESQSKMICKVKELEDFAKIITCENESIVSNDSFSEECSKKELNDSSETSKLLESKEINVEDKESDSVALNEPRESEDEKSDSVALNEPRESEHERSDSVALNEPCESEDEKSDSVALNEPRESEENASKVDDEEDDPVETEDKTNNSQEAIEPIDAEEVRNNLKLQLSSLRNRKKVEFIKPTALETKPDYFFNKSLAKPSLPSSAEEPNSECSKDSGSILKEMLSQDKTTDSSKPTAQITLTPIINTAPQVSDVVETKSPEEIIDLVDNDEEVSEENDPNKMPLFSETNELGLVILSVQGGVEDEPEDNLDKKDTTLTTQEEIVTKQEGHSENTTSPSIHNALSELRKIIKKKGTENAPKLPINSYKKPLKIVQTKSLEKTNLEVASKSNNSPFESNSLDEFLTENAKLNISYNVPKSDAEKGIRKDVQWKKELIPSVGFENEDKRNSETPKRKMMSGELKPKTLAEKRKLLLQKNGVLKNEYARVTTGYQSRRRAPTIPWLKPNIAHRILFKKTGYILYNNQKIWVRQSKKEGCLAKIDEPEDGNKVTIVSERKPSLLKHLMSNVVKYKPGPLSSKSSLQMDLQHYWETKVKVLPQVFFEVFPEPGKRIHQKLLHFLPSHDGSALSEETVDFALTALKGSPSNRTFRFPVAYERNQTRILVRMKKLHTFKPLPRVVPVEQPVEVLEPVKPSDAKSDVESILDDLIRYVEVKHMGDDYIKTDDYKTEEDLVLTPKEKSSPPVLTKHRANVRVNAELRRLNCKIINVTLEEDSQQNTECIKASCQMGCVCKSLVSGRIMTYHCGRIECMFQCICTYPSKSFRMPGEKIILPAGTNLFSHDTVGKLEEQAKKNLAKVEKEFTQTVIQSNNINIVVGGKPRRISKAPKKYDHYFETTIVNNKHLKNPGNTDCFVSLELLDISLKDIKPFCMTHKIHNCICNYMMKGEPEPIVDPDEAPLIVTKEVPISADPDYTTDPYRKSVMKHRKKGKGTIFSKPKNFWKKEQEKRAAAAAATAASTQKDEIKPPPQKKHKPVDHLIQEIRIPKLVIYPPKSNAAPEVPFMSISEFANASEEPTDARRKRKQSFDLSLAEQELRNAEYSVQRRKKLCLASSGGGIKERKIFEGEIIIDQKYPELSKKIGAQSWSGFARLIPWTWLLHNIQLKKIKIWCMMDAPSKMLLNTSDKSPPKNYVDIFETTQVSEIISWIRNRKLPPTYKEQELSFILRPTKNHFEVCGICTRSNNQLVLRDNTGFGENATYSVVQHFDMNGRIQKINVLQKALPVHILVQTAELRKGTDLIVNEKITAGLPLFQTNTVKWRLVKCDKSVAYILLSKSNYSIARKDVQKLMAHATRINETVFVSMPRFTTHYNNGSFFGFYFLPNLTEHIIVGPYLKYRDTHDISLLSGNSEAIPGHMAWVTPDDITPVAPPSVEMIDLTETDDKTEAAPPEEPKKIPKPPPQEPPPLTFVNKNMVFKTISPRQLILPKAGKPLIATIVPRTDQTPVQPISMETFLMNNKKPIATYPVKRPIPLQQPLQRLLIKRTSPEVQKPAAAKDIRDSLSVLFDKTPKTEDMAQVVVVAPSKQQSFQVISMKDIFKPQQTTSPKKRYATTNIPNMGYFSAGLHPDGTLDVEWPLISKELKFKTDQDAISFLQSRLKGILHVYPQEFRIHVYIEEEVDLTKMKPVSAESLNGHFIVGEFGVYDIRVLKTRFGENFKTILDNRIVATLKQTLQDFAKAIGHDAVVEDPLCIIKVVIDEIKFLERRNEEFEKSKTELIAHKDELVKSKNALILDKTTQLGLRHVLKKVSAIKKSQGATDKVIEISDDEGEPEPKDISANSSIKLKAAPMVQSGVNLHSLLKTNRIFTPISLGSIKRSVDSQKSLLKVNHSATPTSSLIRNGKIILVNGDKTITLKPFAKMPDTNNEKT